MKRDIKYIIKRILIGVGIILVMSFINSCQVHAETYNPINNGTTGALYQPSGTQNISFGQNYTLQSGQGITQVYFKFDTGMVDDGYGGSIQSTLYAGSYLFDFYIVSSLLDTNLSNCKDLYTDYRFVDLTSGNTVSAASSIKSQCINSFYTYIDGVQAIHYLVKFTITNTQSYDYMTQRLLFINNLWHGVGFTQGGATYNVTIGNLYDFDTSIVNAFNNAADNGTIISQNNEIISRENIIISAIDGVIARQNQAHTDAQNTQSAINDVNNSINDSSIPSDSESKINSITNAISANQNSYIVQIATFIPQTLQVILNGFNTSCTGGYSLGTLYGTELTIPCINPVNYLGSFLWGVIDSILCLCYLIPLCKFLVNKYNDLTSMKELRWQ